MMSIDEMIRAGLPMEDAIKAVEAEYNKRENDSKVAAARKNVCDTVAEWFIAIGVADSEDLAEVSKMTDKMLTEVETQLTSLTTLLSRLENLSSEKSEKSSDDVLKMFFDSL